MPKLSYSTSVRIWLSLEDYYNNGLTSEEAKEIIERINDPSDFRCGTKLNCEESGLNGNWIVEINDFRFVDECIRLIKLELALEMFSKKLKAK